MFEKSNIYRYVLKKNKLINDLEEAKKEKKDYKIKQIENKIEVLNKKHSPKIIWGGEKGTYKKKEKKNGHK